MPSKQIHFDVHVYNRADEKICIVMATVIVLPDTERGFGGRQNLVTVQFTGWGHWYNLGTGFGHWVIDMIWELALGIDIIWELALGIDII